jgi:MHS family citrate/tricarballylate:H+ symporter-like MFS transporter
LSKTFSARHVVAVAAGNALGFYDFLVYSYFAPQIGHTFFPATDPFISLLLSYVPFTLSFFMRPVGAVVLGTLGDRVGRKPALVLSFLLMGAGIVGLALTPSYARIGYAAPLLVLVFRLVQGFALGGEVGPTTAYMLEAAPPERRGLYASFQATTQDFAVLCAGLVGFALANELTPIQLQDWGWRVAMLLGASIVPFVLIARNNLGETYAMQAEAAPPPEEYRPHLRLAMLGLIIIGSGTILSYLLNYMTTYAQVTLHTAANVAFAATIVNGGVSLVFDTISGWLSDRYGRKPVMIIPGALLVLSAVPVFLWIVMAKTTFAFLGGVAIIAVLGGLSQPPVLVALTEAFPRHIRSRGLATVYAVAIATFGGGTQPALAALIKFTGNPIAPAWVLAAASAIGVAAMFLLPETAPVKTGRREPGPDPITAASVDLR